MSRFDIYGNRHRMNTRGQPSTQHRRGSSKRTSSLDVDDVITVRPIKRIQSAPRNLAYLNQSATRDSEKTRNRPQTAAPCVREYTNNTILDSTVHYNDDPLSNGQSPLPQSSDKQRRSSHGTQPTDKHGKSSQNYGILTTDINANTIHCQDMFESCEISDDRENVVDIGVDDLQIADNAHDVHDGVMDERKNVTFAETVLSDTNYVLVQPKESNSKTHEDLIEKLRQSFGIDIQDDDDDKATETVDKKKLDLIYRGEAKGKYKCTFDEIDDNSDGYVPSVGQLEKPMFRIRSTIRRAPIKKDGRDRGVLVNFLREKRSRNQTRRRVEPDALVEQMLVSTERKPPKRNVRGLFLRTMTFVWYVCRLLGCMIDLSSTMTTRSATEEQWHALHTSKEARAMAFNKAAFAKRRDVNKVPNWAKKIMRKGPEDRTDTEVKRIHALLRGMKSFDRFTEKIQLSMCKSFVYYSINSGRVILRQGHIGQNFYFIFNGSVFVNLDDIDVKGNRFSKTEAILGRGDSFGELALLQDIRRTATITCREDCEMLVVDKDTFARICPRIFEMELEEKMRFVSQMKLFNLRIWAEESLRKMCFEAQIQEYKTNKVVAVDSEKDDWIYICMEGKCQVIRRLDIMEEIEWRKLNQQFAKSGTDRRASRPDYLTVMTGLSNLNYGRRDSTSRRRSVNPAVKQNLLDSMGLEFLQSRRLSCDEWNLLMDLKLQQRKVRRASRGDITSSIYQRGEYGPLTLTSLLANEEKQNGKHLFLDIHTMKQFDVFDLSSVLKSREEMEQSAGTHILVSLGARLMRIKRTSFFKYASQDAVELARGLALKDMYPSDDVLLQRYRDFLHWEVYKYEVLKVALSNKRPPADLQTVAGKGKSTTKVDSVTALYEHNKATLFELDTILGNEDESNNEMNWKRFDELNSKSKSHPTNLKGMEKEKQNKQIESKKKSYWKRLDELKLISNSTNARGKEKTTEEAEKLNQPSISQMELNPVDRKATLRRMSKILMASEFSTIAETEEQD